MLLNLTLFVFSFCYELGTSIEIIDAFEKNNKDVILSLQGSSNNLV